jgi:bifunctional DNase/RNase
MDLTRVEIASVAPCECPSHAVMIMQEMGGPRRFRVRVHNEAGQAILAEMAQLPSGRACCIDMMHKALASVGAELSAVIVTARADFIRAALVVSGLGERTIEVEPCEALVAACRLSLPVYIQGKEGAGEELPEVFQEALSYIDLSTLDN